MNQTQNIENRYHLQTLLSRLRETRSQRNAKKALMPFQVIGDPNLEFSLAISQTLTDNGADILEFGIPFSDPVADGPIIQKANARARRHHLRTADSFDFLAKVKARTNLPISLLVYHNLIFVYGIAKFIKNAAQAGVDSILVIDLPYRENPSNLIGRNTKKGLPTNDRFFFEYLMREDSYLENKPTQWKPIQPVFIVTEMTSEQRLRELLPRINDSYVYLTSRLGVTGISREPLIPKQKSTRETPISKTIQKIRAISHIPIFIGFGIASPEDVSQMLHLGADGVIVGSAITRLIEKHHKNPKLMLQQIANFTNALRQATSS